MTLLNELKIELRLKGRTDTFRKKELIALEQAWFKDQINAVCVRCQRKDDLSIDHIVPVDILKQLGINTTITFFEENLQILCFGCNHFKSNKLDFSNTITKKILISLLERL